MMNKCIIWMLIVGLLMMGCKSEETKGQVDAVCSKISTVCFNDEGDYLDECLEENGSYYHPVDYNQEQCILESSASCSQMFAECDAMDFEEEETYIQNEWDGINYRAITSFCDTETTCLDAFANSDWDFGCWMELDGVWSDFGACQPEYLDLIRCIAELECNEFTQIVTVSRGESNTNCSDEDDALADCVETEAIDFYYSELSDFPRSFIASAEALD